MPAENLRYYSAPNGADVDSIFKYGVNCCQLTGEICMHPDCRICLVPERVAKNTLNMR